jgi:hypothetical protein
MTSPSCFEIQAGVVKRVCFLFLATLTRRHAKSMHNDVMGDRPLFVEFVASILRATIKRIHLWFFNQTTY